MNNNICDVCDIVFYGKEAKILKVPEVDISTDTLDGIKLLEDIDEWKTVEPEPKEEEESKEE